MLICVFSTMVQSSISGTIVLPYENVHYMLNISNLGNSTYKYSGRVGYGTFCEGDACSYKQIIFLISDENDDELYTPHPQEYFHATDTCQFECVYDAVLNRVSIESGYRIACTQHPDPEDNYENMIFEDDRIQMDQGDYPYIRFPRTKDGISISRLCKAIFPNNPTIYLLR